MSIIIGIDLREIERCYRSLQYYVINEINKLLTLTT